ncbi:L,D-transpeptidase family protein [[Lactobacillus] timonensis]|uniref:L,D-transpeptidase family protein n=1 Tax=[Lactobacillus] timonensis TaxID=1970790 RepID=UPI0015E0C9EB|nr:L,D-transpeptidase family protein [[Lactobacillus] timonensis]
MKLAMRNGIYVAICLVVAAAGVWPDLHHHQGTRQIEVARANNQSTENNSREGADKHMRQPINWRKSSETIPYPDLAKAQHLWIKVSLKGNRTYIYDGDKLIYTMYSTGGMYKKDHSTGKVKSMTPTGTFYSQAERGDNFYNQQLGEGANYYVSWLNHGEYLFHSVPTKSDGSYNVKEAKKLGKSTGSHGCIRLSVPDAQWFSSNLPVGTKIEIVN